MNRLQKGQKKIEQLIDKYTEYGVEPKIMKEILNKIANETTNEEEASKIFHKKMEVIVKEEISENSNSKYLNNYIDKNILNDKIHDVKALSQMLNSYESVITIDHYLTLITKDKVINLLESLTSEDFKKYKSIHELYKLYKNEDEYIEEDFNEDEEQKDYEFDTTDTKRGLTTILQYKNSFSKEILTREEEIELKRKIDQGDRQAYDKMVEHNQGLVLSIASRFAKNEQDLMDFIQEGNIGLFKTIEKFDPEKGYKFSTYATWWVRQAVTRYIKNSARTVRLPVHVEELLNRIDRTRKKLAIEIGREPTVNELAEHLNMDINKLERLLVDKQDVVSLNSLVSPEDNDSVLMDFVKDEKAITEDQIVTRNYAQQILNIMKEDKEVDARDIDVILRRCGFITGQQETLESIGELYDITRERVRQIENKFIRKAKKKASSREKLNEYKLKREFNKNPKVKNKKIIEIQFELIELIEKCNGYKEIIGSFKPVNLSVLLLERGFINSTFFSPEEIEKIIQVPISNIKEISEVNNRYLSINHKLIPIIYRISKDTYEKTNKKVKKI